jgi:hypothetical protein
MKLIRCQRFAPSYPQSYLIAAPMPGTFTRYQRTGLAADARIGQAAREHGKTVMPIQPKYQQPCILVAVRQSRAVYCRCTAPAKQAD